MEYPVFMLRPSQYMTSVILVTLAIVVRRINLYRNDILKNEFLINRRRLQCFIIYVDCI